MKKRSRLLALLLALLMLLSALPMTALADEITTIEEYEAALERLQKAMEQPLTANEQQISLSYTNTVYTPESRERTGNLSEGDSFLLPIGGKLKLTCAGGTQWQIETSDGWVDIAGATGETLVLTYAMVKSQLNDNQVKVCCVMGADDKRVATVRVDAEVQTTTETVTGTTTVTTYEMNEAQRINQLFNMYGVSTLDAASDVKKTYNIVINYKFENNEIVSDPYTANLAEGSSFSATVTFPTVQGYLPYVGETQQNSIELNYSSVSEDVTINVVYKPTNVNYTVIHYQQNVENDQYTIEYTETKQGLTASQVPEVAKTYEGFYNLIYEKPAIAADGSTEIEVYYDRYYYLMNFDMDGGYGTEPVYARYGASIGEVTNPTKAGYTFVGWTLDGVDATLPETMPSENRTYVAKWQVGDPVNYAVVYWKENADDSGYSYWGQQQKTAVAGTKVSGSDDIPQSVHNGEKQYFTYNAARTDTDVVVKGDGSTVVNVYYYRNTYTIYFKGISGKCAIEEHTHGTNCNRYLDCLKKEHTHNESCIRYLSCKLDTHEHTEACTGLTCTIPEHKAHTADCLICGKTEHTHSSDCCTLAEHTHTKECWGNVVGAESEPALADGTPVDGQIYKGSVVLYSWSYIYIKGQWYNYSGSASNGDVVTPTCGSTEHTHGTGCTCSQEVHTHGDSCYKDTLHPHTDACYGYICGQAAHTHTDACYTYTCGGEVHTHTDSCYRPCTKLEHTHTNRCNQNSTENVIYVVTAKYEQNIADVWPTADKFPNITLNGWTIDGLNSTAVSKRVNMTSDLCDTSDGLKYAKALTGGSKKYLYYMFESFDQTSPANGNERKYYNGKYYDKSETYYQEVNSDATWNQKQITGVTAVSNGVVTSGSNIYLYYTRNRHDLSFYNVNATVKSVQNIMFEQPLKDYKDGNGNLLSEFTPSYPSSLEPDAYEFAGWYTTPECYNGTEFNFATATMPDDDLTLYAKWVPVTRTVKFYLTEKSESIYKPATADTEASFTVPHGDNIAEEYVKNHLEKDAMNKAKPNGDYTFVMWYYYEDGVKKPFDPTTQIRKDLTLYGEWSSNTLKEYTVQYVLKDDHSVKVADDLTGSGLAGTTKTFDAKGGTDLYTAYQEGYFPTVQSQSLLLDIESDSLVVTFEYVPMPAVPYTVKYVEKDTGKSLEADKVVSDNRKAVVTETFKPITGYMPDAYQKRLVVTADGENILYFYYTKDTEHAYYKITHYIQNTDGATWSEYASSQASGNIGTRYTASPMTIPGYTYKETKYVVNGTEVTDVTAEGAKLTENGLEINLYYVRNEYPYQVRYLEQGSGNVLHDPKNGTGKYGQVISESAIDIDGYDKVDPTSATLNIRIDEGEGAPKLNIITFYYKEQEVTINYVAVGPDGATNFGSVDPTTETVKVKSGEAKGSTATAGDGFKFVGWFKDAACTEAEAVDASWVTDNKIVPQKDENGKNVAATYYAKFEYDVSTLTIVKKGLHEGDSAIFKVTVDGKAYTLVMTGDGSDSVSVTLVGLKVGADYTVSEDDNWAKRYTTTLPENATGKITAPTDPVTVEITNVYQGGKWLDDESAAKNVFTGAND